MKRILVVEDELSILEIVVELLKESGYHVDSATNGKEGYDKFKEGNYNLILTDVMMPILDGWQLAKLIRAQDKNIKIVMLTALSEEYDEIKGFELGVNDYISKPFSFNVLIKRIENQFISLMPVENSTLVYENISLNQDTYEVKIDGQLIDLTLKEYQIMRLLMLNIDKVVTRDMLMNEIWGYQYYGDTRVVDTHIKNLRKKTNTDLIKTVTGVGYKLDKK